MSILYPIPVEFVDGQYPSAKLLSRWAAQIDRAFDTVSALIGDFDGGDDGAAGYVTNLASTIGEMSLINARLPRGLYVTDGVTRPVILQYFGVDDVGKKEAFLTFMPAADQATEAALVTGVNLGTPIFSGSDDPGEDLATADSWCIRGRKVLTSTPIPVGSYIVYTVNTDLEKYRDAFGEDSGVNTIPGIYEILAGDELCTVAATATLNEWLITLPTIKKVMNPALPHDEAAALELSPGSGGTEWFGTAPTWPVPPYIRALAVANGGIIPSQLVNLWFKPLAGGTPIKVVPPPGETISFALTALFNTLRITMPPVAGFDLPHAPGEEGQYIVAFAGTSLAEGVAHIQGALLDHTHDGAHGEAPIKARDIVERFHPARYFHAEKNFNPFPQYLMRDGYVNGEDVLNRGNAMLGPFLVGSVLSSPLNPDETELSFTGLSHPVIFGHWITGGRIRAADNDVEGATTLPHGNKLEITTLPLRVNEGLWVGEKDQPGAMLTAMLSDEWGVGALLVRAADGTDGEVAAYRGLFHQLALVSSGEDVEGGRTDIVSFASNGDDGEGRSLIDIEGVNGGGDPHLRSQGTNSRISLLGTNSRITAANIVHDPGASRSRSRVLGINEASVYSGQTNYSLMPPNLPIEVLRELDWGDASGFPLLAAEPFTHYITGGTGGDRALVYVWKVGPDMTWGESGTNGLNTIDMFVAPLCRTDIAVSLDGVKITLARHTIVAPDVQHISGAPLQIDPVLDLPIGDYIAANDVVTADIDATTAIPSLTWTSSTRLEVTYITLIIELRYSQARAIKLSGLVVTETVASGVHL